MLFDSSAVEKSSNFHQESFDLGYQDACKNKVNEKLFFKFYFYSINSPLSLDPNKTQL